MQAAGALVAQILWRRTGLRAAGRFLVRSLGAPNESVRAIAGMALVKAGRRSEPLLEEALNRREALPMTLAVLADLGDQKYEEEFRQYAQDSDPQIARAARNALRALSAPR